MVNNETRLKYTPTIGIECHVQLKTKTKLFSGVANDAKEAPPNTLISHIDMGMPGALPVLNKEAVNLAAKAAFALGTTPQKYSKFDRKHYFYPDLPKGYQITQYDQPIILGGSVQISVNGKPQSIAITRAHIEEDAGKSSHPQGKDFSLVDLNRAGTPLLEIVSEPDMHSAIEAKAFAKELYLLMKYADVSEANLFFGNMRFDVNVSVSKTMALGTRSETKNLNSFKSVERAVEYEVNRQIELLEKGDTVIQETRGWDDSKQKTFSQRSKEDAHDYRYFPEPDIPPVLLSDKYIKALSETIPVLPSHIRSELHKLDVDSSTIETLVEELPAGKFMLAIMSQCDVKTAKRIANWLASDIQYLVSMGKITWETARLDALQMIKLFDYVDSKKISSTAAKAILGEVVISGGLVEDVAKKLNVLQVSDEDKISQYVSTVLLENPKAAADIVAGDTKAIGYLVGQVMKISGGVANPSLAQEIIKKQLAL